VFEGYVSTGWLDVDVYLNLASLTMLVTLNNTNCNRIDLAWRCSPSKVGYQVPADDRMKYHSPSLSLNAVEEAQKWLMRDYFQLAFLGSQPLRKPTKRGGRSLSVCVSLFNSLVSGSKACRMSPIRFVITYNR
jgi:hypothetical protein